MKQVLQCLLLLLSTLVLVRTECFDQSDIMFLLDHSGRIRDSNPPNGSWDNWDLVKDFCVQIVQKLNISYNGVHVGLITFGNLAIRRFSLVDFFNKADIVSAIRNLPDGTGETNLYAGLQLLRETTKSENGGRPEVQSIAIVLTGGKANVNEDKTVAEAQAAYLQDGTRIFVVGITDQTDLKQIRDVSSPPHEENKNYWITPNFNTLSDVLKGVQKVTCLPDKIIYDACLEKDVVIAIPPPNDQQQWTLLRNYLKTFIERFLPIAQSGVRVALITYDLKGAEIQFGLEKFDNEDDVKAKLNSLQISHGGYGNPSYALNLASSVYKPLRNVQKTLLLFLENRIDDVQQTATVSQNLSISLGVRMIAIDLLSSNTLQDIRLIGTKSQDIIQTTSYNFLQTKLGQLGEIVCGSQSETISVRYIPTTTSASVTLPSPKNSVTQVCKAQEDIIFLLDGSATSVENWNNVKSFVNQIIQFLNISSNGIHVGVVAVGNTARTLISLGETTQKSQIIQSISSMPPGTDNNCNIYNGLVEMRNMFKNVGRPNVTRLAFFLLSSQDSTFNNNTKSEASSAYLKDGIRIYVVGITNKTDIGQIQNISSPPQYEEKKYWYVQDFNTLVDVIYDWQTISCDPGKTYYYPCEIMDVVFAIPTPTTSTTWNYLKGFIQNFISGFLGINQNGVRVGFITYDASRAVTQFTLEQYFDEGSIMAAMESLNFDFGSTYNNGDPTNALRAANNIFTNNRNAQKTLILFLDSKVTGTPDVFDVASNLTVTLGVRVVSIDIDSKNTFADLRRIATRTQDIIQTTDYSHLQTNIGNLADVVCGAQSETVCSKKADIILLIDESTSIVVGGYENWDFVRNFAATIADAFPVSENLTRIGSIKFSTKADSGSIINLNRYFTNAGIKSAILSYSHEGGETNIADGIRNVIPMFSSPNGGRSDVPHIMILITDGKANQDTDDTLNQATLAKNGNVTIFAVGVTKQIDENQLKAIVTAPPEDHYFFSSDYGRLNEILTKVIQTSCKNAADIPTTTKRSTTTRTSTTTSTSIPSTVSTPITIPTSTVSLSTSPTSTAISTTLTPEKTTSKYPVPILNIACLNQVDIIFLLDGSATSVENWNNVKSFVNQIIQFLNISSNGIHVGVVAVGNTARTLISLGETTQKSQIIQSISSMPPGTDNNCNIYNGLFEMRNMFKNVGRPNVTRLAFFLLSSQDSTFNNNTKSEANSAYLKDGIRIYVVGITNKTDIGQIQNISSPPQYEEKKYWYVQDFNTLVDVIYDWQTISCDPGKTYYYPCEIMDVVFAIPTPTTSTTWNYLKGFIKNFISGFLGINQNGVRVGFITYDASRAVTQFTLEQYFDEGSIMAAMESLNFDFGSTYNNGDPTNALRAANNIFTNNRNAQKTLILFLDSKVTGTPDVFDVASNLTVTLGVRVVSIDIDSKNTFADLRRIATRTQDIIQTTDYSHLQTNIGNLADVVCGAQSETVCSRKADIILLIDESTSIVVGGYENWDYVKNFAATIADAFPVSENLTRIGSIKFSTKADSGSIINLNRYFTNAGIKSAILSYSHEGGETNIADGIRNVIPMFSPAVGSRSDVPHILILITDGKANQDTDDTLNQATLAKNGNITIFAVGVTKQIDENQLKAIVTAPPEDHYFFSSDYGRLNEILTKVIQTSCKNAADIPTTTKRSTTTRTSTTTSTSIPSTVSTPITIPTSTVSLSTSPTSTAISTTLTPEKTTSKYPVPILNIACLNQVDIIFLLDGSATSVENWNNVKSFVNQIIQFLNISSNGIHVGVVAVGNTARTLISLGETTQKSQIIQSISSMPPGTDNNCNIYNGLFEMRNMFKNVGRPNVTRLAFFLLSSQDSTFNNNTKSEASSAYLKDGIRIYVVGITNKTDIGQIQNISSPPQYEEKKYWYVQDFNTLVDVIYDWQTISCDPGKTYYYPCEIMDVVFAIPTPTTSTTWNYLKGFIKNFISGFLGINQNGVRVGFITYDASRAVTQFTLEQYFDEGSIMAAMESLNFDFGSTYNNGDPTNALRAANNIFTNNRNAQKTLILFLDSKVTGTPDVFDVASNLTVTLGVRVVSIDIDSKNTFADLRRIATRTQDIIQTTDYSHLQTNIGNLADVVCGAQSETVCSRKADIILLIDESTSIVVGGYENWDYVKNFAATIADAFPVSENLTRIGSIKFSTKADSGSIINLNRYFTNAGIKSAILSYSHEGGETNIADGIRNVIPMFSPAVGSRSDVPHILILITDGKANQDTDDTLNQATLAKNGNITIFAVGVTKQIDENQLKAIVTAPPEDHYFFSSDYGRLNEILTKVIQTSCKNAADIPTTTKRSTTTRTSTTTSTSIPSTVSTPITIPTSTVSLSTSPTSTAISTTLTPEKTTSKYPVPILNIACLNQVDIIFLLDGSATSVENWNNVKSFVNQIIQFLNISSNGIHVGVVAVGNTARTLISLGETTQKSQIIQSISSMPPGTDNNCNIYNGLFEMRNMFKNVGRPNVTRLAFFLLSSQDSTFNNNTKSEASSAYLKDGIRIYVVGITNKTDIGQIQNISSPPQYEEKKYWYVQDFNTLVDVIYDWQTISCDPGKTYYYPCEIMDVVFAIPTPTTSTTWNYLKGFIKNFISGFLGINQNGVRVGFITYDASRAVTQFTLEQYFDEGSIMAAMESLNFDFGSTYNNGDPTNALRAANNIFTNNRNAQKTLILFLDSKVTGTPDVFDVASNLTVTLGVRVVSIDIDSKNTFADLRRIATRTQDIIQTTDYSHLQTNIGNLADVVCGAQSETVCSRKADIILLIDESTSIVVGGYENWDYVKNFAATIADAFPVSENLTRIGSIKFSTKADSGSIINLNRYFTNAGIKSAILSYSHEGGETNIADGIRNVIPMFSPAVGSRSDVPHILILITDGKANQDTDDTLNQATLAKNGNITIFAVGVTKQIDENQLKAIVTAPPEDHYFFSSDYGRLNEILTKVIQTSCKNAADIPTTTKRSTTTTTTRTSITTSTSIPSTVSTPLIILTSTVSPSTSPISTMISTTVTPGKTTSTSIPSTVSTPLTILTSTVWPSTTPTSTMISTTVSLEKTSSTYPVPTFDRACLNQVDIIFLLDGSATSVENWNHVKSFVNQIIQFLNISSNGIHVGVVAVGNTARTLISLGETTQKSQIIQSISSMPPGTDNNCNIYNGLVEMRNMFKNVGRPNVTRLAFFLLSSQDSTFNNNTKSEASSAYLKDGIRIYVVGITNKTDIGQIQNISSPPQYEDKKYWYVQDFNTLVDVIYDWQTISCDPGKTYYYPCEIMDVVFAIPTPTTSTTWNYLKGFIKNFISGFLGINQNGVRVGFITYDASRAVIQFTLEQYFDEGSIMAAMESLNFDFGSTYNNGDPTNALRAANNIFTNNRNAQKTLILFLDSKVTGTPDVFDVASNLTVTLGVRVVSIDIDSKNTFADLRRIATRTQDIIQTTDYSHLQTNIGNLADVVCGAQSETVCSRKADIILLIDESTSIVVGGYENWDYVKNFAATIADAFPVSENLTRIGSIKFSTKADSGSIINLNRYFTNAGIKSAILSYSHEGGETNIADGIRNVIPMFSPAVGSRSDVPHILILITDGKANQDTDDTLNQATLAKNGNITIFAVGVTKQIDENQLKAIVTAPPEDHYFFSSDYGRLNEILTKVIQTSCKNAADIPTTTRKPRTIATSSKPSSSFSSSGSSLTYVSYGVSSPREVTGVCPNLIDVVFVVHSSYNMRVDFFRNFLLKLIENIVINYDFNNHRAKVAVVSFSDFAKVDFYLNNFTSLDSLKTAVSKISYGGYGNNLASSLSLVRNSVLTIRNGATEASTGVIKSVIVILNYKSDNDSAAIAEANLLRKAGVNLYAVGSGTILNAYELASLANYPFTRNMVTVSTARNLPMLAELISRFSCGAYCDDNSCNGGQCLTYANQIQCNCPSGRSGQTCQLRCIKGGDVVFAVDVSRGMSDSFLDVLASLVDITQGLNIGSDLSTSSRVGLLTFDGSGVKIYSQLNSFSSKLETLQSMNFFPNGGANSGLLQALGNATDVMFQTVNGDRSNIPNFLVIITDGDENSLNNYSYEVELWKKSISLRERGVKIITLGVGESGSYLETLLVRISSYGNKNVLIVPRASDLLSRTSFVTDRLCSNNDNCVQNQCKSGSSCTSEIGTYVCGPCPLQTTGALCDKVCDGNIDLAILLFSGGAVHRERFQILINFAVSLVENIDISENRTRIAVIFWATQAEIAFNLNSFQNKHDIIEAIKLIPFYMGGGNNMSGVLRLLRKSVFNGNSGDRPQARNVAIIVTNSPSTIDATLTIPEATQNRIDGTLLIPLALENQMFYSLELESIASHPRPSTIIRVPSFNNLQASVPTVINAMCANFNACQTSNCDCSDELMNYKCTCPASLYGRGCAQRCTKRTDVIFLIDISGSLEEEYRRNVALAREITFGLPVESDTVRVGVVAYSDNVIGQMFLDQHIGDKNAITNSFDYFPIGGKTNTASGLDAILTNQVGKRGDRGDVPNTVIILTDGQSNVNRDLTIPRANMLKDVATIYVVAVGDSPDINEISGLSSSPNLIFNYPFNATITQTSKNIIGSICS